MATIEEAWRRVERWARDGGSNDRCILDLRARVEALEQRALTAPSATETTQPPTLTDRIAKADAAIEASMNRIRTIAAGPPSSVPAPDDRPLWQVMREAYVNALLASDAIAYAAELEAVAAWLAARGCAGSAEMLRTEARRAREGA